MCGMKFIQQINLHSDPFQMQYRKSCCDNIDIFHCHQGLELYFIHDGKGIVVLDGQKIEAEKGMMFLFQPFQIHRIKASADNHLTRSFFLFDPDILTPYLHAFPRLQLLLTKLLKSTLTFPFAFNITESHPLLQSLRVLNENIGAVHLNDLHNKDSCAITALNLLNLISQQPDKWKESHSSQLTTSSNYVTMALEWIDKNLNRSIKIKEISSCLHLTPNHLSTVFQKEIGCSIGTYITIRRISLAKRLLAETDCQVQEITWKIGLNNTSYFCRMFKKYVGMSPYQYRMRLVNPAL